MKKEYIYGLLGIVIGVFIAGLLFVFLGIHQREVTGYAYPNVDGSAFSLHPDKTGPGEGYILTVRWFDTAGIVHDTFPSCIGTNPSVAHRVKAWYLESKKTGRVLTAIQCLD